MPYLIAALVLVGTVCVLNMLLTFGVIRRLREHTKLLDALYEFVGNPGAGARGPSAGDVIGDFATTTVEGLPVTPQLLAASTVVAFLSPDCRGCREQLPELAGWAREQDRRRVLVVVDGRTAAPTDMVKALSPVAQVVIDSGTAPMATAFGIQSYPFFCVLGEDARLAAVSSRIARLPTGTTV